VIAWITSGKPYSYEFPVTFIDGKSKARFDETLREGLSGTLRRIVCEFYPKTFREAMKSSWDVIHCCHISLLPLAVLAKIVKGGRLVYDSYEFPSQNLPSKLKKLRATSFARTSIEIAERLFASRADAVLTIPSIGDQERRKFMKLCKNVEVLLNVPSLAGTLDAKTYRPPPSAIFIGNSSREKGLFTMLEATALVSVTHPEFKLVLVGPVLEGQNEVERKIAELGIMDNIIMQSWVPSEQLGDFLSNAWIGLWPNQPGTRFTQVTTGNSRKGFEYMKYGLPVVASSFGDIARFVEEEQSGILVDASKPEAIAAAIRDLIENPELRIRMAQNGIAAVREKYNWENQVTKLFGIYKTLENRGT